MYKDSGSLQHVFLGELVLTTTQMAETAGLSHSRVGSPLRQATWECWTFLKFFLSSHTSRELILAIGFHFIRFLPSITWD